MLILNEIFISRNFSEDLYFGIISEALQLTKIMYRLQYIPLGNNEIYLSSIPTPSGRLNIFASVYPRKQEIVLIG